jgi:hypothetical protein
MIHFLLIVALFALHILLVSTMRGLKNNVASGIDFALTGAFLSGYWFVVSGQSEFPSLN